MSGVRNAVKEHAYGNHHHQQARTQNAAKSMPTAKQKKSERNKNVWQQTEMLTREEIDGEIQLDRYPDGVGIHIENAK